MGTSRWFQLDAFLSQIIHAFYSLFRKGGHRNYLEIPLIKKIYEEDYLNKQYLIYVK